MAITAPSVGGLGKITEPIKKKIQDTKIGGTTGEVAEWYKKLRPMDYVEAAKKGMSGVTDITPASKTGVEAQQQQAAGLSEKLAKRLEPIAPTGITAAQIQAPQKPVAAQVAPTTGLSAAQIGKISPFAGAQVLSPEQAAARTGQMSLIGQLQQQAAGEGPSLAGMQRQQGFEEAIRNQLALASTSGDPLAARQARQNIATLQAEQTRQAQQTGLAEQLTAQQALGAQLAGVRAQDIGLAQTQAQLSQQAGLAAQDINTQMAVQQAAFEQQAAMTQFQEAIQRSQQNAQLAQQAELAGFTEAADRYKAQASLEQQAALSAQEQARQREATLGSLLASIQASQLQAETSAMQTEQQRIIQEQAGQAGMAKAGIGGIFQGIAAAIAS